MTSQDSTTTPAIIPHRTAKFTAFRFASMTPADIAEILTQYAALHDIGPEDAIPIKFIANALGCKLQNIDTRPLVDRQYAHP